VQKSQVWCDFYYHGIIGPYFFEKCGEAYSNCECRAVQSSATKISAQWVTSSSARFAEIPTRWSNCSYSTQISIQVFRTVFPGTLTSRFEDITWPTHSPELAVTDY